MTVTAIRPTVDLAPEHVECVYERELYVARGVACGDIELTSDLLIDLVANLVATIEEKGVSSE